MVRSVALTHGVKKHLALAALIAVCGTSRKEMRQWPRADEFRAGLRCGMSVDELAGLAKRYGVKGIERSESSRADGLQGYWISERNTRFYLGFDGGALAKVQKARAYGLKGLELSAEENLCGAVMKPQNEPATRVPQTTSRR